MIPAEIATRLRLLVNDELRAVEALRSLPSDLPQFDKGQRFLARIQAALPDGTYRALVAGTQVTLSLPGSAKSGDVLELIVSGRQGNTITAQLAPDPGLAASNASGAARLSPAAQLISQLLTGRFTGAASSTPLNAGEPLLPTPPQSHAAASAQLAPLLRQALSNSGLFYEAHQARWVQGEAPLKTLLEQPQAKQPPLPVPERAPQTSTPPAPQPGTNPLAQNQRQPIQPTAAVTPQGTPPEGSAETRQPAPPLRVAEALMPLVHQQLDTLATQQAVWQGFAWPGQAMQLKIEEAPQRQDQDGDTAEGDPEEPLWQSELRLAMPRLGDIEARLVVTRIGVAVRLHTDSEEAAGRLNAARETLEAALAAVGVTLTGFAASAQQPPDHGQR